VTEKSIHSNSDLQEAPPRTRASVLWSGALAAVTLLSGVIALSYANGTTPTGIAEAVGFCIIPALIFAWALLSDKNRSPLRRTIGVAIIAAIMIGGHIIYQSSTPLAKAEHAAQAFKEEYWNCLGEQVRELVPRHLNAEQVGAILTGACLAEKQKFRVPFSDYLSMKHPEVSISEIEATFSETVTNAAIQYNVSQYLLMETQQPKTTPPAADVNR
jgi:hypothetical protein